MQNRFLLAMLLSLVILSVWGSSVERKQKKEDGKPAAEQVADPKNPAQPGAGPVADGEKPKTAGRTEAPGLGDRIEEGKPYAGTLFLQTDKLRFEFDQKGAALHSAWLLDHYGTVEDKARAGELTPGTSEGRLEFIRTYEGGERAFEMFDNAPAGADPGWANTPLWQTSGPSADGRELKFTLPVVMRGESFTLVKTFRLTESTRRLEVQVSLESNSSESVTRHFWLNTSGGVFPPDRAYLLPNDPKTYGHSIIGRDLDGELELEKVSVADVLDTDQASKVVTAKKFTSDMGVYFGAYLWPAKDAPVRDVRLRAIDRIAELRIEKVTQDDLNKYGPMRVWSQMGLSLSSTEKGKVALASFDYYLGPKDHRVIREAFANDPEKLKAYLAVADEELTAQSMACCSTGPLGWIIQSVSKAVVWALSFFTDLIGSAGAAIILLTICVRVIMFPITRKSQVSMHIHGKKMAKLKPKIEALKEKYKNDPQKLQKAHMQLLRESDTKLLPLGGCLPMFLQIPIFFGLFSAIRFDYDLRHASFLWCQDLSMPDRLIAWEPFSLPCFCGPGLVVAGLNVLPLLMIAAMFFHQLGMPKSPDPQMQQQQKMMMFMPLMFGVFMYAYAAGLSVYWLSSSLFGIFEQRVIKKMFPIDKEEAEVLTKKD